MRPRHYDRFVLIGLCWLYGRSEVPPPLSGSFVTLRTKASIHVNDRERLAFQDDNFERERERDSLRPSVGHNLHPPLG